MSIPTIAALPEKRFLGNDQLVAEAARRESSGAFEAAGMLFDYKIAGWFDVAADIERLLAEGGGVERHLAALRDGYPYCFRLLAVRQDGNVYAVWEVYSKEAGTLTNSKSRTVEVDADWTGRGIGTAFVTAVLADHPIEWSSLLTPAGAKLKDRVESSRASKPTHNFD